MKPGRIDRPPKSTPRNVAATETDAGNSRPIPCGHDNHTDAAADDLAHAREQSRHHHGRADVSPAHRMGRRLGLLEYGLLALIALGISITIAMAIANPSA